MTPEQLQAIKAYILATPALADLGRNDTEVARQLNLNAVPEFVVWRTLVTRDEIMQEGFSWTEVDGLSVGKARIWEWLFDNETRAVNPSQTNVRAGIVEVWSGTAGKNAVQAAVLARCKRPARLVEKVLATGTGSTGAPGLLTFEGQINIGDIGAMWNNG